MRRFLGPVAACALLSLTGCSESDQVTQFGPQTLEIVVTADASAQVYDVWEFFRDGTDDFNNNGVVDVGDVNGTPDDVTGDGKPDVFLVCELSAPGGVPDIRSDQRVPWGYTVDISRIPAGQTEAELMHDPSFVLSASSLTPYSTANLGVGPARPSFAVATPYQVFRRSRKLLQSNRIVLEAPTSPDPTVDTAGNPSDDPIDPNNPSRRYCPFGLSLGEPRIAGTSPPPFLNALGPGDTVIFKVRKTLTQAVTFQSEPILRGEIRVGGAAVTVAGSCIANAVQGAGFSCSYTSR